MKIEGRTFVISGGASGLGRALAEELVRHGGAVALLDRNDNDGKAAAAALAGPQGDRGRFYMVDVTDSESIAVAVRDIVHWTQQTGRPLGGVVPAAGVGFPALMLDRKNVPLALEGFDFVVNINLRGVVDLVRQFLPHIAASPGDGIDQEHGVVVMVASSAAFDGQMGQVAYAASKGAVAAMTLPMARDLSRYGIRVVTIAPSLFDTSMTDGMAEKVKQSLTKTLEFPQRPGQPEEFAILARHIIENVMLNGTVLRLDGASRMPARL